MGWAAVLRVLAMGAFVICGSIGDVAWSEQSFDAMSSYQMGLQAERAGNLDEALQNYQNAIRVGGDVRASVGALARVATIQMLRRAYDEAEEAIAEALQRDHRNSDALLAQARLRLLQDNPRKAARNFEELSRREPDAIAALLGLVEAAVIQGDGALLKQARGRLAAFAGNNTDVRKLVAIQAREDADFFSNAGKPAVAVRLAELSFSMDPSASSKKFLAGMRYQSNDLDSAAALFREILPDPQYQDEARAMLDQIEVQRKELQLGAKRARLVELQTAARQSEITGRLQDAISAYEEMIAFGKGVFDVEVRDADSKIIALKKHYAEKTADESRVQASESMRAGRYDEAVRTLHSAKTVVGADLVLDGMLAEALLKSSAGLDAGGKESALREILDLETGLEHIQSALPSAVLAQTHAQLGILLESKKQWEEAVAHYEAARAGGSTWPDLSRRLFMARFRARIVRSVLLIVAIAGIIAFTVYRWPNAYRAVLAVARYKWAVRQQDPDRQYHALSALVALLPHRLDLRRKLAVMAEEKSDEDVCLYLYEQLHRERGIDRDGLLKLFAMYERRNDIDKLYAAAADLLKESLDTNTRAKILETRFRIESDGGRMKEALQTGRELLALKPSPATAEQMVKLVYAGSLGNIESDIKTLLPVYRTWMRLQPSASDRIVSQSESILKKALAGKPADPDPAVRQLAQFILDVYLKSGEQKRAAEFLESLRLTEKDPVPSLQNLLKIYTSLGDAESVLRTLRLLHEYQPANFEFGMKYAELLKKNGDLRAVEAVLLKVLSHHPNSVELVKTLTELAKDNFESGDPEKLDQAVDVFRAIIGQTFLDTKDTRLLLARSLIKKGQTDEAIAILQAIEGGGYPRLRAQSLVAEAFLRKNQPGLAVDILSKVNFEDPQITQDLYKEMRYLQSEALEAENRLEEAVAILDELILRDITFKDVKHRHERLSHVRRRSVPQENCPACAKPNPAGSRFCSSCGTSMTAESPRGT